MQNWKPRYLIFAKRPNVKFHCEKIIKKQFWKSKFSYSNFVFSDNDCKFGTHAGKRSAKAEFFSLEVHKWRKKDFLRRSLCFQIFNESIGHVECTFGCHAKKIPQKGCIFLLSVWHWSENVSGKKTSSSSCWFSHQNCTFEKLAKERSTKPGKLPAQGRKMMKKI